VYEGSIFLSTSPAFVVACVVDESHPEVKSHHFFKAIQPDMCDNLTEI
jgi:hypothetical protein